MNRYFPKRDVLGNQWLQVYIIWYTSKKRIKDYRSCSILHDLVYFRPKNFSAKDFFGQKIFFCAKLIFSAKKYSFVQKWFFRPKNIFVVQKWFFLPKNIFCAKMIFSAKKYFFVQIWFFRPKIFYAKKTFSDNFYQSNIF